MSENHNSETSRTWKRMYDHVSTERNQLQAENAELRGNIKNMSEFIKSISKDVFNQYVRYMDEKNNNQ